MKVKIGYLIKVINENSIYYNKIGIITITSGEKLGVYFSRNESFWIPKQEVEYLCDNPQFNINWCGGSCCFWCRTQLKIYYIKGKNFSYCPKCLR